MKPHPELNPATIKEIRRDDIGLQGWLVIDRHAFGNATGGVRMRSELTLDEVANLAREMSFKYDFLNIKKDGAKSGIVAPIDAPAARKAELCRAFGQELARLIRANEYVPGEDMGVGAAEYGQIMGGAGIRTTPKENPGEFFTALTAVICVDEYIKDRRLDPRSARVSIEGYGKVGGCAGRLLTELGARLVGVSTVRGALYHGDGLSLEKIEALRATHGDDFVNHYPDALTIPRGVLIEQPTDIFMPGAQPDSVNLENIPRIKARCLVSIANIAVDEDAEAALWQRGIDYYPGFVANCGGILSYYLREQEFRKEEIENLIRDGFARKVARLTTRARAERQSISATARRMARENHQRIVADRAGRFAKLLDPPRYLWIAWRKLGRTALRPMLASFARGYIHRRLFEL